MLRGGGGRGWLQEAVPSWLLHPKCGFSSSSEPCWIGAKTRKMLKKPHANGGKVSFHWKSKNNGNMTSLLQVTGWGGFSSSVLFIILRLFQAPLGLKSSKSELVSVLNASQLDIQEITKATGVF